MTTVDSRQSTELKQFVFSLVFLCGLSSVDCGLVSASEVPDPTHTQVIIREHPKTGKPYVSLVSTDQPVPEDPFTYQRNRYSRPDYRMLDPNVKKGEVAYDGPYSDRKKVYLFGAALMALGVTGATAGIALAPAAGAASSGGGAYLAGGAAVAAGSGAAVHEITKSRPEDENFIRESESRLIESENKQGDIEK